MMNRGVNNRLRDRWHLRNRLLTLDSVVDDLRFLHLNRLHLMMNRGVNNRLRDRWHFDDYLLKLNLGNLDRLLNDLRAGHLGHNSHIVHHDTLMRLACDNLFLMRLSGNSWLLHFDGSASRALSCPLLANCNTCWHVCEHSYLI